MFEQQAASDTLSIKDVYEKICYFLADIKKKWFVVALCSLSGLLYLAYYAYSAQAHYEADLDFVVKTKNSSGGGIEDIIGQLGWGGGGGTANLDKVKSVAFSKSVLEDALYEEATINGKKNLIVNHIYELYGLKEEWEKDDELSAFNEFSKENRANDSSMLQNIAFRNILGKLRGNKKNDGILAIELDENTDMISFKVRSINEKLSYSLSNSIFESLNRFYMNDEVSNTKQTLTKLKVESDSVAQLIRSKEYQLANAKDRNYGIILSKNQVNQEELQRDIIVLSGIYAEMRKNLEIRSFSLKSNSSIFDILEYPVLPLKEKTKSVPIYAGVGLFIGLLGSIVLLIVRRFLLDEIRD